MSTVAATEPETGMPTTEPLLLLPPLPGTPNASSFGAFDDSQVCETALRAWLLMYEQQRERITRETTFWVFTALYGPAGLVGVLGNALTVYIFATKMKSTPTSAFVIALAVVDLCVCLTVIPSRFASILLLNFGFDALCKGSEFVFFAALPTSGLLLVAIAVDRFVLICLARSDLITPRAVRVALALTALAGAAIGLPSLFTVSVYHDTPNAYENVTRPCLLGLCKPTQKYIGQADAWIYWIVIAALYFAMVLVLTSMYLMIFLRVLKTRKKVGKWAHGSGGSGGRPSSVDLRPAAGGCAAAAGTHNGAKLRPPQARAAAAASNEPPPPPPPDGGSNPAASLLSVPCCAAAAATLRGSSGGDGGAVGLARSAAAAYNSSSLSNAPSAAGEQDGAAETTAALVNGPSRRARKKRLPHVNTAVTLCLVTGTFVVAYLPVFAITLSGACSASSVGCEAHEVYGVLWHFFLFNHVVNPIIYAFMNPRFKEALCAMLPHRGRRRSRPVFFTNGQASDTKRSSIDLHSATAQ